MCELMKYMQAEKKSLKLVELTRKCRYHKKINQDYVFDENFRGFKCLELFNAVYPKVLALMYDGIFSEEELLVSCPNVENSVKVRIVTRPPHLFKRIINKAKRMVWFLRPMDVVSCIVSIEVISVSGKCLAGYETGSKEEVYHYNTICPQALYTAFPAVLLSEDTACCKGTSHVNQVTFEGR